MSQVDNTRDLTHFKALSFDCYGTLIDWETGLTERLRPLTTRLPADHPYTADPRAATRHFDELAHSLQTREPGLEYGAVLARSFRALAAELEPSLSPPLTGAELETAAAAMAAGPGEWPPFADTIPGLQILARHYKLIILSNVSKALIARTVSSQLSPAPFAAVYTAQDIGSYKPSHANFAYLFRRAHDELGVDADPSLFPGDKGQLLHVARSLTADHVPARELGLPSVWISRGGDRPDGYGVGGDYGELLREGKVAFGWKFDTIGDLAAEVARQFGDDDA